MHVTDWRRPQNTMQLFIYYFAGDSVVKGRSWASGWSVVSCTLVLVVLKSILEDDLHPQSLKSASTLTLLHPPLPQTGSGEGTHTGSKWFPAHSVREQHQDCENHHHPQWRSCISSCFWPSFILRLFSKSEPRVFLLVRLVCAGSPADFHLPAQPS